ncbi:hypothetical protein E4U61_001637 [Claviceps capensis]|nr:hypothetical protein E4U61_001637 [Claviceps capensis]
MATPLSTRVASLPVLRKRFPGFPCRRGQTGLDLIMKRGLSEDMDVALALALALAVDGDGDMERRKEGMDEAGPFPCPRDCYDGFVLMMDRG